MIEEGGRETSLRKDVYKRQSYSNVAFFDGRKYVTPDTFLLNGTRRQYLLGTGAVSYTHLIPRWNLWFELKEHQIAP